MQTGANQIFQLNQTRYNAGAILFDNLGNGNAERTALIGPAGRRSYRELCAEAWDRAQA